MTGFITGLRARSSATRIANLLNSAPRRLALAAAVALLFCAFALSPAPAQAQTLGIDCEVPRRSADGRYIIDFDKGARRMACEADREAALHWSRMLFAASKEVRWRLRDDTSMFREQRRFLAGWSGERFRPVPAPTLKTWLRDASGRLPFDPDDWAARLNAGVCFSRGKLTHNVTALVWMDISDLRDRWAPEMVRNATWFWHLRDDIGPARANTPDLLERDGTGWALRDMQNETLRLHACDDVAPNTAGFPKEGLLIVASQSLWSGRKARETRFVACPAGEFGRIEKRRHRVGGVVFDIHGNPLQTSGGAMVSPNDPAAWVEVNRNCWPPGAGPDGVPGKKTVCTSDVTVGGDGSKTVEGAPSCPDENPSPPAQQSCAQKNPDYPLGEMIYQTRTYTFPDGDSKWDKITGYRIENRCYRNVPMQKGETRNGKCPAGHTGAVKETRQIRWCNFERAPGSKARPVDTKGQRRRNLKTFRKAKALLGSPPAAPGPCETFYPGRASGIVGATPWQAQSDNCRPARTCGNTCAERGGVETRNSEGEECVGPKLPKCRGGGGNGGNGGPDNESHNSWDVDGDGRGDYADRNTAESAGHTGGRSVADDCSSCGGSYGDQERNEGDENE